MDEARLLPGIRGRRWRPVAAALVAVTVVGAVAAAATRERERLTDRPQPITFVPADAVDYPAVSFRPSRVELLDRAETEAAAAPLAGSLGLEPPTQTAPAHRESRLTLRSVGAERPGVYAGERGRAPCDPRSVIGDLAADPKLAELFTKAQNSDISLAWRDPPLDPEELDAWSDDLTPVHLAVPTRVALHQIDREGRLHKTEAVLAPGTAVGVDLYGVPRLRCRGGEPLTAPTQLNLHVEWISPPGEAPPSWAVVIQRTAIPAEHLVLADTSGGLPFRRPVGTHGERDRG
ncbi:MAG: hypothetical protein KatS3mg008_2164 [Acidimicrobiales bacterium]|nr:MAG: hypothetical protein KatS3mg008_2164 [Acidimicrobiales bacterium]